MKPAWEKYLLYASVAIVVGSLVFILIETIELKRTGFETKTLWDWMELLVIPLVLAIGAFYLNRSERNSERQIATDRQQEIALQAYLDRMSDLLLKESLRVSENAEVWNVARIRTLTVLRGLDAKRKAMVLLFLYESGLISRLMDEKSVIRLDGADLTGVELSGAFLNNANLSGANLSGANLSGTLLMNADLWEANLSGANLTGALLMTANLKRADVSGADLTRAELSQAFLNNADLSKAKLEGADLTGVDLTGAEVSGDQLTIAKSLKNAKMPDGTKHE